MRYGHCSHDGNPITSFLSDYRPDFGGPPNECHGFSTDLKCFHSVTIKMSIQIFPWNLMTALFQHSVYNIQKE